MIIWILLAAALLVALFLRYPYFIQDVRFVRDRLKARELVLKYMQTNYSILDRFFEVVKAQPHKPFVLYKDETYSFQDADELSNKAARVFLQIGLKEGDKVALFLKNEPMFLWMWLGLVKIGCSGALLNYNIRSKSLLHCFSCVGAKTLVAAGELQDAVEEVLPTLLEQGITVLTLADRSENAHVQSFKEKMNQALSGPLPKGLRSGVNIRSPAAYIYTSGTTGLPKAAEISHARLWLIVGFMSRVGMTTKDVIYISLPLYHTAGFIGFVSAIDIGITMVLRDKFSASNFWDDCRKYNVTVFQYIGEIMRYLCNTPKKLSDRSHKVRLAIGNGIRADVWRDFIDRFGNVKIKEFYGATEGNFGLVNYVGKIGTVGRDFWYFKKHFPYAVIKFDIETATPLRNSSGFCIEADKGEPGLLVTEISPGAPFCGYVGDLQQTEKKKLRDVFKKGDLYFNTGDLLRIDEENFFYFHDRVGDTFRWKGENVATTEVADILTMVDCIKEANVYGVAVPGKYRSTSSLFCQQQSVRAEIVFIHSSSITTCPVGDHRVAIPADIGREALYNNMNKEKLAHCFSSEELKVTRGQEGRCGMAAVTLRDGLGFHSAAVCKQVENFLPGYARPRFLRVQSSMDVTGTFKHLKAKLVEEGFNPNKITEPLFYLDEKVMDYVPLTLDIFNAVTSGKIKF